MLVGLLREAPQHGLGVPQGRAGGLRARRWRLGGGGHAQGAAEPGHGRRKLRDATLVVGGEGEPPGGEMQGRRLSLAPRSRLDLRDSDQARGGSKAWRRTRSRKARLTGHDRMSLPRRSRSSRCCDWNSSSLRSRSGSATATAATRQGHQANRSGVCAPSNCPSSGEGKGASSAVGSQSQGVAGCGSISRATAAGSTSAIASPSRAAPTAKGCAPAAGRRCGGCSCSIQRKKRPEFSNCAVSAGAQVPCRMSMGCWDSQAPRAGPRFRGPMRGQPGARLP